ncbi:GtrA family protein [Glycocaulis sp.]|uniref:GtrA family protein n=1 Tax=Glycocaulis sp. TaxID=1969725 RepID=UPI003D1B1DE4
MAWHRHVSKLWLTGLEVSRFVLVGGVATVLHNGIAWLLVREAGLEPFTGNFGGYAVAAAWSYLGHLYWTFGQHGSHRRRIPRFLAVSLAGYFASNVTIWIFVVLLGAPFEIAIAINLVLVPASSWILHKFWTFTAIPPD